MKIMECRQVELARTLEGLHHTETPLVSEYGGVFHAAGFTDDQGIYYFIPKIAHLLGVSSDLASTIFFSSLWICGFLIILFSLCLVFKNWAVRLTSAVGILLLLLLPSFQRDVYMANFFAVAAIVPLLFLWNHKKGSTNLSLAAILALSGLIIGYCEYIRCYSGMGVLLFAALWIFLNEKLKGKEKIVFSCILLVFVSIPYWHFKNLEYKRDEFLVKANPKYKNMSISHPLWHTVYIGLGHLKNKHGIEYSDSCALYAAEAVDKNVAYCSKEYDQILKRQFFKVVENDPFFIVKTILSKIYNLLQKILLFANLGLLFCFYVKPGMRFVLPFIAAALFYSIPGILALPADNYVLGLITIAAIFGIYMTGFGLEKYLNRPSTDKPIIIP